MPLNRQQILNALKFGRIGITDLDERSIQPRSVDLHAGEDLEIPRLRGRLTYTMERLTLGPRYCAWILLNSTPARKGLTSATALWFDEGWDGVPNLELFYWGSLHPEDDDDFATTYVIKRGDPICQAIIFEDSQASSVLYGAKELGSRYQGQTGTTYARELKETP